MYPASEVRAAAVAARRNGVRVLPGTEDHPETVRLLERGGFLPRDRARVEALVDRVTREARVRVEARRVEGPTQLAFPLWGPYADEGPTQLAFAV